QKYVSARDGKGKILFQETEDWVLDQGADWLFSFASVCDTLGFDPDYLRRGLLQWKANKLEGQFKAKVYQLAPRRAGNRKSGVHVSRRKHRLRKVASR
ncbi:MAG TPA: hypothetical protein VLX11_03855, partial [Candidatus Acidoferrales bacterium]|nr:hypothetical protein [Candidatus Acidoferrales bacterium]